MTTGYDGISGTYLVGVVEAEQPVLALINALVASITA
jgi:hypothetical protein